MLRVGWNEVASGGRARGVLRVIDARDGFGEEDMSWLYTVKKQTLADLGAAEGCGGEDAS